MNEFQLNSIEYFGGSTQVSDLNAYKLIKELLTKLKIKRTCDVTELYLPRHSLTTVPTLQIFRNLTKLWLQKNRIQKLEFIQSNERLAEIYLQNNLIQDIDNCFRNLRYIKILFLNGNQLANLNSVANELSYLQYLENLNLFDNPIALERNYRVKIIHSVQSLRTLDRLVINDKERKKAFKLYEKKHVEIHSRYAFMKTFEQRQQANATPISRASLSRNSVMKLKTPTLEEILQEHYDLAPKKTETKEISYFDWTKVKLYANRFKEHENESIVELPTTKKAEPYKVFELPQIITFRF